MLCSALEEEPSIFLFFAGRFFVRTTYEYIRAGSRGAAPHQEPQVRLHPPQGGPEGRRRSSGGLPKAVF